MKKLAIALSLAIATSTTFARTPSSPMPTASGAVVAQAAPAANGDTSGKPQRSKMKGCNADAKTQGVHGPERRAFMKQCLSGKAKPATAS